MSYITALKFYYAFIFCYNPTYSEMQYNYNYCYTTNNSVSYKIIFRIETPKKNVYIESYMQNNLTCNNKINFLPQFEEYSISTGVMFKTFKIGYEIYTKHPTTNINKKNYTNPSYIGRHSIFIKFGTLY